LLPTLPVDVDGGAVATSLTRASKKAMRERQSRVDDASL
jgi:hypothetical protein